MDYCCCGYLFTLVSEPTLTITCSPPSCTGITTIKFILGCYYNCHFCHFCSQTVFHGITIIGSILLYFVFSAIYNAACIVCNHPTNPYWIMERQFSNPTFYLICLITPTVALLPRFEQLPLFLYIMIHISGLQLHSLWEWNPALFKHDARNMGNIYVTWACNVTYAQVADPWQASDASINPVSQVFLHIWHHI